jgi:ribosome-associated protein
MQAKELKLLVVDALEDIKAEDIQILDVTAMTDFTDFMIIATGKSTRQVKALANAVNVQAKAAGVIPLGMEGEDVGEWALVDLGDVIVHVMTPEIRATYTLEKLWSVPAKTDDAAQVMAEDK